MGQFYYTTNPGYREFLGVCTICRWSRGYTTRDSAKRATRKHVQMTHRNRIMRNKKGRH